MNRKMLVLRYAAGVPLFVLGAVLSAGGRTVPAALCFVILSLFEAGLIYRSSGRLTDIRLLFSLGWLIGIGVSCLKLSERSRTWGLLMWLVVGGFWLAVCVGQDLVYVLLRTKKTVEEKRTSRIEKNREAERKQYYRHVEQAIWITAALGLAAFLAECIKFRFAIPILVRGVPHAYTAFHISGLHYFIVSLVFVHVLSLILFMNTSVSRGKTIALAVLNVICFLVPVMLLSKFQVLIAAVMPLLVWTMIQKRFSSRTILMAFLAVVLLFTVMTVIVVSGRDYPEGYLQDIFRFKKPETPMFIQYPYMYIANNFENLNLLVEGHSCHTMGIRSLTPFLNMTGLKRLASVQAFMNVEHFQTVLELSTLTIVYDIFQDFDLWGTLIFGLVLGGMCSLTEYKAEVEERAWAYLLYAQFAVYMSLSFFTAWFSDATTWFWLIASTAIGIFCARKSFTRREKA